ncbi:MAG: oligosaccharide flippase family protein [Coriobacteriaceae bacterium]
MNKHAILQNMSVAFLAQGVSLLLSVLQTLLVPKLLGVEQYGYWQLYIFYISYVGFFHLGLSSGVYLATGGQTREEMDKASIKSQMLFGAFYETIMAVVIVLLSTFLRAGAERTFVIVMTAIYLVLQNLATFMMNELQCMNETKKSSCSTIIERLAFLVPLLVFLVMKVGSFYPYVFAYTTSTVVQLAYCAWNLRDFWETSWLGMRRAAKLSWESIKIGFPMMLANIMSMLILGIGRFFIDAAWGIETFGRLSLALSLVSFFLAFVSQASMVLFPSLRQASGGEVRGFYKAARDAMGLLFPMAYAFYFPLAWILSLWLPAYADTFVYLIFLLPICVFDSKYNITGVTYYNVLRRERTMLAVNSAAAAASLVLTLLAVYVVKSVFAVIATMTFVIAVRSVWSELYMNRLLSVAASKIGVVELALTVEYIAVAYLLPAVPAFAVYTASYTVFLAVFRQELTETVQKLRAS